MFPPESGRRRPPSSDGTTDADDAALQKSVHDASEDQADQPSADGAEVPVGAGAKRSLLKRKRNDAPDDETPADEKNSARA